IITLLPPEGLSPVVMCFVAKGVQIVNTSRLRVMLLSCAVMLAVPSVGISWQSGRLKNQKPAPRPSNTSDSSPDATPPDPAPPLERDTSRPDRSIDPRYSKIAWEHGMRSALKSASADNRVIVVDVYTDWCGWCKRMDKFVYSDPKVAALG